MAEILKEKWSEMTISELIDQRAILFDRYDYLISIDASYATSVDAGIKEIDRLISEKLEIPNVF